MPENKPQIPEKVPLETDAGTIPLGDMRAVYGPEMAEKVPKREIGDEEEEDAAERGSQLEGSEMELLGFTKIDMPSEDKHSRTPPPEEAIGDSFPALRRRDSGDLGNEMRLRRQVDDLQQKLLSWTARAEIAEEKAELAEKKIQELKDNVHTGFDQVEKDTETLAGETKRLQLENQTLKEQLQDAQSHIFSLQPYRKELTPEEVGRDYDDLIEGVTDWVQKFMSPFLDDLPAGVDEVMQTAKKRPTDVTKIKQKLQSYPDLVHGTTYPETDEDIIISIVMRYLHDNIFQKILYGTIGPYVEVLSFVETQMQNAVEPKRDLFAIRTWTAEAYNAILSAREFRSFREKRLREMTMELGSLLRLFCKKENFEAFFKAIEASCVKPAMTLYEKLLVSTHHFYLDINPYIVWGPGGELETSSDFIDNLRNLDCKNILQNRKAFNLAKLDPTPTKKELYHHLLNVCTLSPALYMRQIGRKDAIKEPVLVRRQQMLVAWGPQEKRDKFRERGDRPLMAHIYYTKTERERAEAWVPFRWG